MQGWARSRASRPGHRAASQAGRFAPEAVQRRQVSYARNLALPRNVLGEKLIEFLQPVAFRAVPQQQAEEIQVLNRLRELKAELRVIQIGRGIGAELADFEKPFVLVERSV